MSQHSNDIEESLILYQTQVSINLILFKCLNLFLIRPYQLDQINAALRTAPDDQKLDLLQLQQDLEEIIELTKQNLNETHKKVAQETTDKDEKEHLEVNFKFSYM